jgi:oligopeptide/dipeptide ABC transporter ATP-binding protein
MSSANIAASTTEEILLEVRGLTTHFVTRRGLVRAVNEVSLRVQQGGTLALVGESGCGKSVLALSIMRLVPPPGEIVSGQVLLEGRDLLALDRESMRRVRGREIAMIFQDPMTSLNPVFTVGDQVSEAIRLHEQMSRKEAWRRAVEMMGRVRIPDARRRAHDYPHELSGGMRQRVMIAMALSCNPKLLIADEPTTALDVTIQAEILDELKALKQEFELSLILISHDLGVVAETADRVAVMYAGKIVEQAPVRELFYRPRHPYTEGLLRAVPRLSEAGTERKRRLETIEGVVPNPLELPPGCRFAPRCPHVREKCRTGEIPLIDVGAAHSSRCIRVNEIYGHAEGV